MVMVLVRSLLMYIIIVFANTNIHNKMAEKVIRSPIVFFDSNPIGRISTRFTKDLVMLDMLLPPMSTLTTQGALRCASVVISISIVNLYLIILTVIALGLMYFVVTRGITSMLEAQRFD